MNYSIASLPVSLAMLAALGLSACGGGGATGPGTTVANGAVPTNPPNPAFPGGSNDPDVIQPIGGAVPPGSDSNPGGGSTGGDTGGGATGGDEETLPIDPLADVGRVAAMTADTRDGAALLVNEQGQLWRMARGEPRASMLAVTGALGVTAAAFSREHEAVFLIVGGRRLLRFDLVQSEDTYIPIDALGLPLRDSNTGEIVPAQRVEALRVLGVVAGFASLRSMVYDEQEHRLVAVDRDTRQIVRLAPLAPVVPPPFDLATLAPVLPEPKGILPLELLEVECLALDSRDQRFYGADRGRLFRIDNLDTGVVSVLTILRRSDLVDMAFDGTAFVIAVDAEADTWLEFDLLALPPLP